MTAIKEHLDLEGEVPAPWNEAVAALKKVLLEGFSYAGPAVNESAAGPTLKSAYEGPRRGPSNADVSITSRARGEA